MDLWPDLSVVPRVVGGGKKDAAVIVGVENYAAVAKVPGARRNADDWQAYLTEGLKVPLDRIALLRDNEATLEELRHFALEESKGVKSGGTLWFIFIGHGAPAKDGEDGLLVGWDAQQRVDSLYDRSLPIRELLGILSKGRQAKTVVVVDACFSGRSHSGDPLVPGLQPLVLIPDRLQNIDQRTFLLTAAASDQFAGPLPESEKPRPAFSYLVLGALRGWAADAEGKITAGQVLDFTNKALKLAKDRTQIAELMAGSPDAVLGLGHESSPDLAKIDRLGKEAAGPATSDFQFSNLPALPSETVPKAIDARLSELDFRTVDINALTKYDAAVKFDKSDGSPEEKAKSWRALAQDVPKFVEMATARAVEWERFAPQQRAAYEARARRIAARDADWGKLSRLLDLSVVADADKNRWVTQFLVAYSKFPGVDPSIAKKLAPYYSPEDLRSLDFQALRNLSTKDVYMQLVRAKRTNVAQYLDSLPATEREKMTDYILKNKGTSSVLSWAFILEIDLKEDEENFVVWYLRKYTDYKPRK